MTALLVSCAVTFGAAPFVRRLMLHNGVLDIPNHRSSHTLVTPRGGGLACLLGVVTAAIVAASTGREVPWVALLAAVVLGAVGYADDRRTLPAVPRLLAQVAVGVAVGAAAGGLLWALAGAVALPVTVNIVNFMDGINGITGLHVGLWGVTALLLGSHQHISALIVIGAVAAGSSLGFLPWNVPVAKLFLGDVGSYLLGGLVGAGIIYGVRHSVYPALVVAPMTLYLVDTAVTLLRRALHGASLMEAHREHVYQQLTSVAGYSHAAVSLGMAALGAVITGAWLLHPAVGAGVTTIISAVYLCAMRIVPQRHTERSG